MNTVLDSSAILAYLRGETGGRRVDELLLDDNNECFAHAINLCEVYYDVVRSDGLVKAQAVLKGLTKSGLAIREDMDSSIWQQAGIYKADLRRVSLADCFCLAMANRIDGVIITADREFDPAAGLGLCEIEFIR